jgi:signal transduction histidine kinase
VTDNGIGISDDEIDNVMLPFGQVASVSENNKMGTGLALAIVKQLT